MVINAYSTIFQLYRGGQFYWWRNYHSAASHWQALSHNVVSSTPRQSEVRTHNVSVARHWLHTITSTTTPLVIRMFGISIVKHKKVIVKTSITTDINRIITAFLIYWRVHMSVSIGTFFCCTILYFIYICSICLLTVGCSNLSFDNKISTSVILFFYLIR